MDAPPIQYCQTTDGVSIAYWTIGEGPLAVFANPIDGSHIALEWDLPSPRRFYERLSETCQVIRFGPRNSAFSDVAAATADGYAADIAAVADAIGAQRFALVTTSDAIAFAGMFAQRYPSRLNCTVALQPRIVIPGSAGSTEDAIEAVGETMPDRLMDIAIQLMDPTHVDPPESLRLWMSEAWRFADQTPPDRRVAVRREAGIAEGRGLQAPILIVDWPESGYSEGLQLARLVPGARVVSRAGKGSWPWNPDLDELATLVSDFVWEHSRPEQTPPRLRSLEPPAAADGFRTILFTDVVALTPLLARLKDARMREVMRDHDAVLQAAVDAHGGRVVKTIGDAFMAEFAVPSAAVECAIAMQRGIQAQFADTDVPIRLRIGINAGEPVEEDGDLHGASVVIAKRLESAAAENGILVSDVVKQMVMGKDLNSSIRARSRSRGSMSRCGRGRWSGRDGCADSHDAQCRRHQHCLHQCGGRSPHRRDSFIDDRDRQSGAGPRRTRD